MNSEMLHIVPEIMKWSDNLLQLLITLPFSITALLLSPLLVAIIIRSWQALVIAAPLLLVTLTALTLPVEESAKWGLTFSGWLVMIGNVIAFTSNGRREKYRRSSFRRLDARVQSLKQRVNAIETNMQGNLLQEFNTRAELPLHAQARADD